MDFIIAECDRINITNAIHCTYKDDPSTNVDKLEQLYLIAKDCYYVGNPFFTDESFDNLEDLIRARRPNSKVLIKVGGEI